MLVGVIQRLIFRSLYGEQSDSLTKIDESTALAKCQYLLIKNLVNSKILWYISKLLRYSKITKKIPREYSCRRISCWSRVELKSLLDHTASSILVLQGNVVESITGDSIENVKLENGDLLEVRIILSINKNL